MMLKLLNGLVSWSPDALMVAGAGVISHGAWLVYAPAGWIIAGLFLLGGGYLAAKGSK